MTGWMLAFATVVIPAVGAAPVLRYWILKRPMAQWQAALMTLPIFFLNALWISMIGDLTETRMQIRYWVIFTAISYLILTVNAHHYKKNSRQN